MEPKFVEKEEIILVGFSFFGDPFASSAGWTEENEIGRLWQRLMAYLEKHANRILHLQNAEVAYEVHVDHDETPKRGHHEVFVGMQVERLEALPPELLVKILPPTQYAVFTLVGEQIVGDWPKQIYDWLHASPYQLAYPYNFQYYDQRFKGLENIQDSILDIYVPVNAVERP
ncbi:MAG: GyrI-like domain-containing protein [Anaerolineales bacterium]|nr:GyrI-like domain-containing protein [Anaerolineales bacterium]